MIKFAARSETGRVRKENEDNLFCNGVIMDFDSRNKKFFLSGLADNPCVFAVCDGIGGEDCGEIASLTVIKALADHWEKIKSKSGDYDSIMNYIRDSAKQLNAIMSEKNISTGTTLALIVINHDSYMWCNLGDSRIYRFTDGQLIQISTDYTVAAEKMKKGLITPAQAANSPEKHILTRFLGGYPENVNILPEFNFTINIRNNGGK